MKPDLITITTPESSQTWALIEPDKLAELRAIVGELATSNPIDHDGYCVFCGRWQDGYLVSDPLPGHEADCLIMKAREAMQ